MFTTALHEKQPGKQERGPTESPALLPLREDKCTKAAKSVYHSKMRNREGKLVCSLAPKEDKATDVCPHPKYPKAGMRPEGWEGQASSCRAAGPRESGQADTQRLALDGIAGARFYSKQAAPNTTKIHHGQPRGGKRATLKHSAKKPGTLHRSHLKL